MLKRFFKRLLNLEKYELTFVTDEKLSSYSASTGILIIPCLYMCKKRTRELFLNHNDKVKEFKITLIPKVYLGQFDQDLRGWLFNNKAKPDEYPLIGLTTSVFTFLDLKRITHFDVKISNIILY